MIGMMHHVFRQRALLHRRRARRVIRRQHRARHQIRGVRRWQLPRSSSEPRSTPQIMYPDVMLAAAALSERSGGTVLPDDDLVAPQSIIDDPVAPQSIGIGPWPQIDQRSMQSRATASPPASTGELPATEAVAAQPSATALPTNADMEQQEHGALIAEPAGPAASTPLGDSAPPPPAPESALPSDDVTHFVSGLATAQESEMRAELGAGRSELDTVGQLFEPRSLDRTAQMWTNRLFGAAAGAAPDLAGAPDTQLPPQHVLQNEIGTAVARDVFLPLDRQQALGEAVAGSDETHTPTAAQVHGAEPALFTPRPDSALTPQAWATRLLGTVPHMAAAPPQAGIHLWSAAPAQGRPISANDDVLTSVKSHRVLAPRHAQASATLRPLTEVVLSATTRRFLRPLVGVDPASVRIYRGPAADALTSAAGADALAIGEDVLLSSAQAEGTTAEQKVLAHEITHVARRRASRFAPPVLRTPMALDSAANAKHANDEETLALQVEAHVRDAARAIGSSTATVTAGTTVPETSLTWPAADAVPHAASSAPTPVPLTVLAPLGRSWNGVPAPWEPLPAIQAHPELAAPDAAMPLPVHEHVAERSSASTLVKAAAEGRVLPRQPERPTSSALREPLTAPEIDLDALAHEIYRILKRRLATELRRIE